ncbi:MAG: hypothetical protein V2A77_10310 [Pseudomonadota bacterium]
MVKKLAAAVFCAASLATAWAQSGPQTGASQLHFKNAGIYDVSYEVDGAGNLSVKSLTLVEPTQEIVAHPGATFGVQCEDAADPTLALQAGFTHPEGSVEARFWGVEAGFTPNGSAPGHFYGFVFDRESSPIPGTYSVNLYRAADGSLIAHQVFKILPKKPSAPQEVKTQEPDQVPEEKKQ